MSQFITFPKIGQYNTIIQGIISGERFRGISEAGEKIFDGEAVLGKVKFTGTVKLHGCFHADTEVTLSNGERIPIREIQPGNSVLTYDCNNKKHVNAIVSRVYNFKSEKKWIRINFDNNSFIRCTEDHKFYTTNRGWICAKDITPDDEFISDSK